MWSVLGCVVVVWTCRTAPDQIPVSGAQHREGNKVDAGPDRAGLTGVLTSFISSLEAIGSHGYHSEKVWVGEHVLIQDFILFTCFSLL